MLPQRSHLDPKSESTARESERPGVSRLAIRARNTWRNTAVHISEVRELKWLLACFSLSCFLILRSLWIQKNIFFSTGLALLLTGMVVLIFSLRTPNLKEARTTWFKGIKIVTIGLVFLNSDIFSQSGLSVAIALWIIVSLTSMILEAKQPSLMWILWIALGISASGLTLYDFNAAKYWIPAAIGLFETASATALLSSIKQQDVGSQLLDELEAHATNPLYNTLRTHVVGSEPLIRQVDTAWLMALTFVLFQVHMSRMGFDPSLGFFLGLAPALFALLGDFLMAFLLAFLIIIPVRIWWMRLIARQENLAATMASARAPDHWFRRLIEFWVAGQIRFRIRLRRSRFSVLTLLRTSLILGLPLAAVITATIPLLGMSWFFDTEKWASLVRDKWAAYHVQSWRQQMVAAANPGDDQRLILDIPGIAQKDFSFIVIGDPGQGGLAQRALAAQIVNVAEKDDVQFVFISSDVVYPNGEMRDYESKFWLPFKGISKPIVAIPGNHDWYDGLDGFSATFYRRPAAIEAIAARKSGGKPDNQSRAYATKLVDQAEHYRKNYKLDVQQQSSPYFQIQNESFLLLAIDTGVVPGIDDKQMEWLRKALVDARGKTIMAILGHPIFVLGRDSSGDQPGLAPILKLLREERVSIVMGGDTHDLEYYLDDSVFGHTIHHFVNGGGGAYVSIGRAFGAPEKPDTDVWAYYPRREAIMDKISPAIPAWAAPLWWWTRELNGYPLSSEVLSSAFDFNESPFLQSFMVVKVETSKQRIRLLPYGVDGRLKWKDFALSNPTARRADDDAEWTIPMVPVR